MTLAERCVARTQLSVGHILTVSKALLLLKPVDG